MKHALRLARWLRLVVACLAFVLTAAPAVAAPALAEIVLIAEDEPREEARVEIVSTDAKPDVAADRPEPAFEAPVLVSRRYLANCALLL